VNNRKLESIIKAYKILKQNNPDSWIIDCSNADKIENAIELAATARNSVNKKHDHQHRITTATLESFADRILEKSSKVKNSKSFDDLISVIGNCRVKGISDLTIYDTAQRIGGFLDLYPERVYLHRGTRKGAEILLGKLKENHIAIDQLPQPFQVSDLTASEAEDILCIYKDRLKTCI
jgi:hypothetical protein